MALNVLYRKNTLFINNKPLNFDYTIGNAFPIGDKIVFMLEIPQNKDTLRNIYCLNSNCQFMWQVQSPLEAYPETSIWVQVVYLGGGPRKHWEGCGGCRQGRAGCQGRVC